MTINLSVIIPAYNTGDLILETVSSILIQKEVSFEVIIVNDCSTDNTLEIINKISAEVPQVRVISLEKNSGQATARNVGIDNASGEYICLLDSDDLLAEDTSLKKWYDVARKNKADMVRANYYRFSRPGECFVAENSLSMVRIDNVNIINYPHLVNNTACWQFLYRRTFLNDQHIRFSDRLRQREDRPFFTLSLLKAKKVSVIPDVTVAYRVRDGSTMRTVTWDQLDQFVEHLVVVDHYIKESNLDKGAASAFLTANLLFYLSNISKYWSPLLLQEGAISRLECLRLLNVLREIKWSSIPLSQDEILDHADKEKKVNGYYDVLWQLIKNRRNEEALFFLRHNKLTLKSLIEMSDDAKLISSDLMHSLSQYFRSITPIFPELNCSHPSDAAAKRDYKFILHVGMTKTGSSALQQFMEINRIELLKRGVYYPYTGIERGAGKRSHRTSGHALLINNIIKGNNSKLDALFNELKSLPLQPKVVVISSENIVSERFWQHGDGALKISKAFQGYPLKVVVYYRRQIEWLESMYAEAVTSPGIRYKGSPEEFYQGQEISGLLDYYSITKKLEELFGVNTVTVKIYDSGINLFDDFFGSILGIHDWINLLLPDEKESNPSAPKHSVLLINLLNRFNMAQVKTVESNAMLIERLYSKKPGNYFYFEEDLREAICDRYSSSNIRLAEQYLNSVSNPFPADIPYGTCIYNTCNFDITTVRLLIDLIDSSLRHGKLRKTSEQDNSSLMSGFNKIMEKSEVLHAALGLPIGTAKFYAKIGKKNRTKKTLPTFVSKLFYRIFTPSGGRAEGKNKQIVVQEREIANSGLFDVDYYCTRYPDIVTYSGGAIRHYLLFGAKEQRNPSRQFNTSRYLRNNRDVAETGMNPLLHYIRFGQYEGRIL
jgi:capsular polysaccharide export protein